SPSRGARSTSRTLPPAPRSSCSSPRGHRLSVIATIRFPTTSTRRLATHSNPEVFGPTPQTPPPRLPPSTTPPPSPAPPAPSPPPPRRRDHTPTRTPPHPPPRPPAPTAPPSPAPPRPPQGEAPTGQLPAATNTPRTPRSSPWPTTQRGRLVRLLQSA